MYRVKIFRRLRAKEVRQALHKLPYECRASFIKMMVLKEQSIELQTHKTKVLGRKTSIRK